MESLISSANGCLYHFFHENGYRILRSEWDPRSVAPAVASYQGWVYAFYDSRDNPLYIGETGRSFLRRFKEHGKSKNSARWWPDWTGAKILPCPSQTMRKFFESMLGLEGDYQGNVMQPAGEDNMFDEVILSLLLLRGNSCEFPIFPNDMVRDHAEAILELVPAKR